MNLDPVISFPFSLPNINGDNNYERERERERGLDGDMIELQVYDSMQPIRNIHV